ncbi:hypothetical protein [Segeticoccus rhizosphaerae]|uniref:hypothetical protein n=1 Tax=Segeticoccus rhizosphaerae TaxID=1104777 RepID=UPI001263ECD3|nr:hypothetical protein [Segeticoccus rhizosphaerae]
MSNTLRRGGGILLLGGALVASACSGGVPNDGASTPSPTNASLASTPPSDPPASPTAPTTPPTSSHPPPGPKAVAKRNARKVLDHYFQVSDTCLIHPKRAKKSCFDKVAIGTELRNNRNALANEKVYGTRVIGRVQVVSVKPVKVDLTNKPKHQPPVIPTVVFEVCYDVSKVNVVDASGKSIVPSDRIDHGRHRVSVYNYEFPDQSQWRVGYVGDPVKDPSC